MRSPSFVNRYYTRHRHENMKKKSLVAILLEIAALFTACGSEAAETNVEQAEQTSEESSSSQEVVESQYPEYLNLETAYPVIKDEYADEITLTAAILMQDNAGEWENLWINQYFKEKYNIKKLKYHAAWSFPRSLIFQRLGGFK